MLLTSGTTGGAAPDAEFAYIAQRRLLNALGRETYAFMCLRWEAVWLLASLTEEDEDALAPVEPAVLALRLQSAAADGDGRLSDWADAFASCTDLHRDVLCAQPAADGLHSPPTDTPERVCLVDRAHDLLGYAHRFEDLALKAPSLRRAG